MIINWGACPCHDQDRAASGLPLDERTIRGLIRGRFSEERPSAPRRAGRSVLYWRLPHRPPTVHFLPTSFLPHMLIAPIGQCPSLSIRESTSTYLIMSRSLLRSLRAPCIKQTSSHHPELSFATTGLTTPTAGHILILQLRCDHGTIRNGKVSAR